MLSTSIKTTSDLMSVALQTEREASRHYSQLAAYMRKDNNEASAELFERLVGKEQEHEHLLQKWMTQEDIKENPDIDYVHWSDPQVLSIYNDEACDPHNCTPYKALAFAVHNQEVSFRFYTHVAADSKNETVRQYAEILAREELGHTILLRAERRRAFHKERQANSAEEPKLNPLAIHNEADLLVAAIYIDRFLVKQMKELNKNTPEIDSLTKEMQQQITKNEDALSENALNSNTAPGENITQNLEQLKLHNAYMKQKFDNPNMGLQRLWACCDRSFAFYDLIVETTSDESILHTAQKLTSAALDRISVLKRALDVSDM